MPKKGDLDTCLHCRQRITYGRYYTGKGKSKKRWMHEGWMITCPTKPANWKGEWPKAKPLYGRRSLSAIPWGKR